MNSAAPQIDISPQSSFHQRRNNRSQPRNSKMQYQTKTPIKSKREGWERSIKERLIPVQSCTQNCCQGFLSGQPLRHQDSRRGAQERSVSSDQIANRI